MDKLKDYIQQHANDLNFDEPSPKLWGNIESKIHRPKAKIISLSILQIGKWIAAACIIALAGLGVKTLLQTNNAKQFLLAPTKDVEIKQPSIFVKKNIDEIKTTTPIVFNKVELHPNKKRKIDNGFFVADKALEEIDNQFVQVLAYQKDKINNTPLFAENPSYFSAFKEQMQFLDNDEKNIRKKIRTEEFNMEFLNALITIYQQKLDLLKCLQTEMNKLNNKYKQNRGPIDSTNSYFINI